MSEKGASAINGGADNNQAGSRNARALWSALFLTGGFMVIEVAASAATGSLALLADAGHMLTDAGALAGAIWAGHLAERPASGRWSFGMVRAEIVSAAANGVTLLVVAGLVLQTAIRHLLHPPNVAGFGVVVVACAGIAVNVALVVLLGRADRLSLNIEGAFRHVATDLVAFVGTAIAGGVIYTTGLRRADPIASILVAVLILRAAWGLLSASGRILLEGTPDTVDLSVVRSHMSELPEVIAVHDLHAWTLTSDLPVISAHVVVDDACLTDGSAGEVLDKLQDCLKGHFDVEHSTIQLEPVSHLGHESGVHE